MIRRDYILQMIEEFIRALTRIESLKAEQRWSEAAGTLDEQFQRVLGKGAATVVTLSETEMLARLMEEGPTQAVREKTFMLATLFTQAGDVAAAQEQPAESRAYYLKALHLLLDALARGDTRECPEFVPKVELLKSALQDAAVPSQTHALLMQHHERTGEFAKAEDELFALLEAEPDNGRVREFGVSFYQRLLRQSDVALVAGNLPREEVEEGLRQLQQR